MNFYDKKGQIICGFPGIGKSTFAKFSNNWIDLESTPFEKDWHRYAKVAKHMSDNGYNVLLSTHEGLLSQLEQLEIKYTVIVPPTTDLSIYVERYKDRGNDKSFISLIEEHWEEWIYKIITDSSPNKTVVILPEDGDLETYMEGKKVTGAYIVASKY